MKIADAVPRLLGLTAFRTDRLAVTHWRDELGNREAAGLASDLAPFLTPKVLAPLPPSFALGQAPSAVPDWIEARAAEADVFNVRTKDAGRLVGLLLLSVEASDATCDIHIGYLLAETAWGKGLATELVAGLVESLPRDRGVTLFAGVAAGNAGSARVLEKVGFTRDTTAAADDGLRYRLTLGTAR